LPLDLDRFPGDLTICGYALITNTGSTINMGGLLPDGTPFFRSEPINEQDEFPVYASLYQGTGLLLGRMSLSVTDSSCLPATNVVWVKPSSQSNLYPNGFSSVLATRVSPWTNTAAALAALFPNNAHLVVSGFGLASNLVSTVQLTSANTLKFVSGSTNFTSGTINRVNGQLSLTFRNTSGQRVTAYGTLLQNPSLGGGFFLSAEGSGSILLQP